jgi:hypothetical protein
MSPAAQIMRRASVPAASRMMPRSSMPAALDGMGMGAAERRQLYISAYYKDKVASMMDNECASKMPHEPLTQLSTSDQQKLVWGVEYVAGKNPWEAGLNTSLYTLASQCVGTSNQAN